MRDIVIDGVKGEENDRARGTRESGFSGEIEGHECVGRVFAVVTVEN